MHLEEEVHARDHHDDQHDGEHDARPLAHLPCRHRGKHQEGDVGQVRREPHRHDNPATEVSHRVVDGISLIGPHHVELADHQGGVPTGIGSDPLRGQSTGPLAALPRGVARKLADELANGPTVALGVMRSLLFESVNRSFDSQLEMEASSVAVTSRTKDNVAAMRTFGTREKPGFTGT